MCGAWQRDQWEAWSAAAPLGRRCLVLPSVCLCDTALFLSFRAPCWLPVRAPKQGFPSFRSTWLLGLCEDIDCPLSAGGCAQAEGWDVGGEKHWCFAGFSLSDLCFSCPARILRVKLIARLLWEWILPLGLFVRGFLCPPPLSIPEVTLEALLQARWPQPLHSLALS